MLNEIIEYFPDENFLKIDGFDEAIIGIDEKTMRLIYSVKKIISILSENMEELMAIEYYSFNIAGAYMGEKTPIFCEDNF